MASYVYFKEVAWFWWQIHIFTVVAKRTVEQEEANCAFDSWCVLASKSLSLLQEFFLCKDIETNGFLKKVLLGAAKAEKPLSFLWNYFKILSFYLRSWTHQIIYKMEFQWKSCLYGGVMTTPEILPLAKPLGTEFCCEMWAVKTSKEERVRKTRKRKREGR